ncbi:hypothetical protein PMAYCL1PPCAC_09758 [Pristionchus mayeri]|uniref:Uncharacterized protein n=1 Tax=Pristionchus mayeri TaxID=1317129 RepID=A0AAN4ZE49_9BILA|nr:hypothetical protein PMAYCL1PPCAC_09758 [Pristionchus mayeri]
MTSDDAVQKVGRTEKMGLLGAVSYIIGNIVGSGIFITPGTIVSLVGSVGLALIVWLLSAFIATLGAFCYVELGTSIRKSGADFAYLCYVKWYPIAFAFMCTGCIIIYPATLAIQADTFSEYVFKGINITMESDTELYFAKKLTGFSLIWFLLFLNFFSLKTFVSRFQIVASIAKIAATALVIGTGFYFLFFNGWTCNIEDPFGGTTFAVGTFVSALFSGLYSYDGWDILNFGAEEIDNPKRTMPLAIVFGMTFIALLYLLVNFAYFVVIPIPDLLSSPAVAQTFGEMTLGSFSFIIPVFVALLLIGSLNSTMFSASRYLQAAAKQGHLPSCISCINPISDSPRVALLVHVLLAMGISFAGDLNQLINYVSFSQWSQRGCTMAALIYIRFTHKPVHPDRIRTFILLPILFCLICWTLVVVTIVDSFDVSVVGIGIVLAGFVFFFLFIFEKSLPSIPAYRTRAHKVNEITTIWSQIIFNVMPELDFGEDDADLNLHKVHPAPSIEGSIACEEGMKRRVSTLSHATQTTDSSTRF